MQRRVNVRGIIVKDGKLFCQRLHDATYWCTPGGGMDLGETLQQGLHREMIEETGIAPTIGKLLFIQQFFDGKKEQLEFFFYIENADDYATICLADTTHGEAEVAECGFVDTNHDIKPAFLRDIDVESYIREQKPVYIYSEL